MSKKRKITVHTAFKLNLPVVNMPETYVTNYEPGVYEVSDEVADHWYTQQHADEGETVKAPPVPVKAKEEFAAKEEPEDEEEQEEEVKKPQSAPQHKKGK